MVYKKTWLFALTLLFVFSVTIVGNLHAQTDNRLNGTWIDDSDDDTVVEMTFNNGNYEQSSIDKIDNEQNFSRGTYTASNGRITFKPAQMMFIGSPALEMGLVSGRWYSITEFSANMRNVYSTYGMPADIVNQMLELIVTPPAESYSITGNTLTITVTIFDETETLVYRRK